MKILSITQARFGSSRLPGKVLKQINGKSLLEIHFERLVKSKLLTESILATTNLSSDDPIEKLAINLKWKYYRGSENDVLDRFYKAVDSLGYIPDYIVRLTADCPLVDSSLLDLIITKAITENLDYCSNTLAPSFPDGMDVEVFKYSALRLSHCESSLLSEKEHVTPYIWKNSSFLGGLKFSSSNFSSTIDYSHVRLTVDELKDFEVIQKLIAKLGIHSSWLDYVKEYLNDKEIYSLNNYISRNEGYYKSLEND
jgi:spore coat polysaccharide biosynthesis protein SpsF